MKQYTLFIITLFFLVSCTKNDDGLSMNYHPTFKLVSYRQEQLPKDFKFITTEIWKRTLATQTTVIKSSCPNQSMVIANLSDAKKSTFRSNQQRALCFGIYDADMDHPLTSGYNKIALDYLKQTTALAKDLAFEKLYDYSYLKERVLLETDPAAGNTFRIKHFHKIALRLQQQHHLEISTLLLISYSIENAYLACLQHQKCPSIGLKEKIGKQLASLSMLKPFLEKNAELKDIATDLENIRKEMGEMGYKTSIKLNHGADSTYTLNESTFINDHQNFDGLTTKLRILRDKWMK